MGCDGCKTGRGDSNVPAGCNSNGNCGTGGCNQMNVFDWLTNMELPANQAIFDTVEVRFKNGRKAYFKNDTGAQLLSSEIVAVESSPGHDIGTVSLTGELVKIQINKKGIKADEIKKVYRKAKPADVDKWQDAIKLETPTMTKA